MQLDAEEDDQAFYKPPVDQAARTSTEERRLSGETSVDPAAATITAEED